MGGDGCIDWLVVRSLGGEANEPSGERLVIAALGAATAWVGNFRDKRFTRGPRVLQNVVPCRTRESLQPKVLNHLLNPRNRNEAKRSVRHRPRSASRSRPSVNL